MIRADDAREHYAVDAAAMLAHRGESQMGAVADGEQVDSRHPESDSQAFNIRCALTCVDCGEVDSLAA